MSSFSRRRFLKTSSSMTSGVAAAVVAAKPAITATAESAKRITGANDRIRVGLIGCGSMGAGDLRDFLKVEGTECVALCDVDSSQIAEVESKVLGPASQKPDLRTQDFRRVLDRNDIDAVIIATPDHWHAIPSVMACQAGKDVYVEKPLALTIEEGRAMVQAAQKYNRVVQMGTQQRSASHYREAVDYVKSGKLGKIRLVRTWAYLDWKGKLPKVADSAPPAGVDYDMWLGPAPARPFNENRFHFSFRWYWDYSGGLMTDWGAHMIDIANWAMGVKAPRSAMSIGGKYGYPDDDMQTPDTQQVLWGFSDFSMVWEHALGVGRGPEAREHGVQFHGNKGVLVIDRAGWSVYPETDKIDKDMREYRSLGVPRQNVSKREDYHLLHVANFADCVRSRERPRSDVESGHNSMIACHLGNIAFRLGRRVNWDIDGERVIGDAEAQQYVQKKYRSPWKLKV